MKKLIIAACAMAMAAVVNASAFSWSMSKVYEPGTENLASGYSVFLFVDAGQSYDTSSIVSMIESGVSIAGSATTSGAINAGKASASGIEGGLVSGNWYSAVAVVFDATSQDAASNYFITAPVSKQVPATGTSVAFGFGAQTSANWTEIAPVPEPTSGLLMLIGMAGLALRRRRA